ncbi:MAG: sulfotransferase domain-containing protein [Acidimicrobiia bacterium]|nr:sulfotransferase domain-containing protein [Acidimicrobiia bacterium]
MRVLILGEAKSGTTMLHRAICDALGTPPEQSFFEPEDLGELDLDAEDLVAKKLLGNLRGSEKKLFLDFDRRVLLVRDPRDRFVSWLLYDIHGRAADLEPEKIAKFIEMLRKKEEDPSEVPFLRLTHAYWRLTGNDLLSALARSTARMNDLLGRFRDLFEVVQYELYVAGESSRLEIYLGVDELGTPDVGPDLQRVVRTKGSGDWKHWFTDRDLLWLRPMVSGVLRRQGYPRDWELAEHQEIDPEHCSRYVERLVASALDEESAGEATD